MQLRWKNNTNKAIGVAFATNDDAKVLVAVGYCRCEEEDCIDDDGVYVKIWRQT